MAEKEDKNLYAPGTIFHGNFPPEKTVQWSFDEQDKNVINIRIDHPWLGILACTYHPDPALYDHLQSWGEELFAYQDKSNKWHIRLTPALFAHLDARRIFIAGVGEALKNALEVHLVETKNRIGIETHPDPQSIRTSQVEELIQVQGKITKKRMGVELGRPLKPLPRDILSRYEELCRAYKDVRVYYDDACTKYNVLSPRNNDEGWRKEWDKIGPEQFPGLPPEVVKQCDHKDKYSVYPSILAMKHIATDMGVQYKTVERYLTEARKLHKEATKRIKTQVGKG